MIEDLVSDLAKETALGLSDVRRIINSAPRRYKEYYIDKRSGGKRLIAHPARELKVLQRAFLKLVLNDLPVHRAATAYRPGLSLRDNVLPHAGDGPILKMDFANFFPSIRGKDWTSYCRLHGIFSQDADVDRSANLLFRRGKYDSHLTLSIGAPTSPSVSNILMYSFDEAIFGAVAEDYVIYTRYADDLTFSAPRTGFLTGVRSTVAATVRKMKFPKLEINADKTRLVTAKYHRDITGLTLSQDGRVTVGQVRRRNIRAGITNYKRGILTEKETRILAGHIAFVNGVEPTYLLYLKERHGDSVIAHIMSGA